MQFSMYKGARVGPFRVEREGVGTVKRAIVCEHEGPGAWWGLRGGAAADRVRAVIPAGNQPGPALGRCAQELF